MSAYLDQPSRRQEHVALDMGRRARHVGMPVSANRFKPGTMQHKCWFDGWAEMDKEITQ